jgi:hypothetical protein
MTILLLGILSCAFATDQYFKTSTQNFTKDLEKIESSITQENWEESTLAFQAFKKNWETARSKWLMLIDHIYIDNVHESIVNLESYIDQQNRIRSLPELHVISYKLTNIYETNKLSVKNIL